MLPAMSRGDWVVVAAPAVAKAWQWLLHIGTPVRFPAAVAAVIMTPSAHRLHHEQRLPVDLGPILTVWDRVAGTYLARGFAPGVPNRLDYPIPIPAIHGG